MTKSPKRVALVTGGSQGIEWGIADSLAESGFDLAISGASEFTKVVDSLDSLKKRGAAVEYCQGDLTSARDREAVIAAVRSRFGRLDVLVNNATTAPDVQSEILATTEDTFDRVLDVNLKGPYFLTQLAARWMIEERNADSKFHGVIVNVSSTSSAEASVNRGDYCISKAGIAMATQLWAHRLAEFGISVYEVRPGLIQADLTAASDKHEPLIASGVTIENRLGKPEDIGRAVAMLARGDLSYATGNVLNIDGGLTLRRL